CGTRGRLRWSATRSTTWSRSGAEMLRVGRIPYLNCEPFFHGLRGVELVDLIPRRLGEAMAEGQLDAGPLSLMDYLRLAPARTPLSSGIGCPTGARSVLVFSDRPLSALDGARVGITEETSTSVELLRVLLALRYEVEPGAWVTAAEPCDAVLLIGDQAIRRLTGGPPARYVADLGLEWREGTGLPFVFARWAVASRVPGGGRWPSGAPSKPRGTRRSTAGWARCLRSRPAGASWAGPARRSSRTCATSRSASARTKRRAPRSSSACGA